MNSAKQVWKILPQSARMLACAGMCGLFAQKRQHTASSEGDIYICGAFRSSSGIGHGARLYALECLKKGYPLHMVDISDAMLMKKDIPPLPGMLSAEDVKELPGGGTVVIHANPPQYQMALCFLGKKFLADKHVVAYWSWEIENLPRIWTHAFQYADAVEAPSTFVCDILRKISPVPVYFHPHCLPPPRKVKTSFSRDGVLRCLNIFDAGSSFERKNPMAALEAFRLAFPDGGATLTFKVNNSAAFPDMFAQFREECQKTPGVAIISQVLDERGMERLYLENDVYLSLHRSEGYGLPIREALDHGLYAVATGWSGNMDFMDEERAIAAPCTLVPAELGSGAYKDIPFRWAEPDIMATARILRDLREKLACFRN